MATSDIRPPFDSTRARYCSNCGGAAGQGRFCSSCGHPLADEPDTQQLEPRHAQEGPEQTKRFDRNAGTPVTGLEAAERLAESTPSHYDPVTDVPPPLTGSHQAGAWWSGHRRAWIVTGMALVVAAAGVAAALMLSSSSGGTGDASAYREQVAKVFAP